MSDPLEHTAAPEQESIGSGVERRIKQFGDFQQQMADFGDDLANLKAACDNLKRERSSLIQECAARNGDKETLAAQVNKLKNERDALQLEYAGLVEDERFWRTADAAATTELEQNGRVTRQLWVQTEKVAELQRKLTDIDSVHKDELEAERVIASSLRERIGRLERSLRDRSPEKDARRSERESSEKALAHEVAVLKAELDRFTSLFQDTRDSLDAESKRRLSSDTRADTLAEQLHRAREEILDLKLAAAQQGSSHNELLERIKSELDAKAAAEREKLNAQLQAVIAERDQLKSESRDRSPRALMPVSPNVATPRTPTKTPAIDSLTSHKSEVFTPSSTSLAKRYAHLEEQHRKLKAEYDRMKNRYRQDVQHWKEYRAVQQARDEIKQRRREERKTYTAAQSHASSSRPSTPVLSQHSNTSVALDTPGNKKQPDTTPRAPKTEVAATTNLGTLVPETVLPEPPTPHAPTRAKSALPPAFPPPRPESSPHMVTRVDEDVVMEELRPAPRPTRGVSAPERPSEALARGKALSLAKATSTPMRIPAASTSTPLVTNTARRLAGQSTRVTPWLGGKSSTGRPSTTPLRRRDSFGSDEEVEAEPSPARATAVKTPLVRDRTGAGDLRRTMLQRTVTHVDSPAGDTSINHPSTSSESLLDPSTPGSTSRKRALDLEGLSPAERALERKKLARLSTSEKRELYASYKGNGRYLAPEDLQRTATDEYEIDPAKNGGVSHQYHDVVRNREERKKMHGGDCECCKDYYEAVGPLPRFNQGPAWKSPTSPSKNGDCDEDADADADARTTRTPHRDLEDHQNRVSRHRETWRKPPTPPGFWRIGFPSTQEADRENAEADEMNARRDAEVRREAAHRDSKWRKKA